MRSILLTCLLTPVAVLPAAAQPLPQPPRIGLPFDSARAATLRQEWGKAFGLEPEFVNSIGMQF